MAGIYSERCLDAECASTGVFYYWPDYIGALDITAGRIVMLVRAVLAYGGGDDVIGIAEIRGLPQMFDTLLTFVPSGQTLSILTPAHPEGFRSVDAFQVWAGNLQSIPDWSQAQPLACTAAQNPTPGQVVSVADTLPDPGVGEGRYYLVASQSGTQRRLGRQYVNGAFSARGVHPPEIRPSFKR